ncbi:hypothetical protein ACWDYH_16515 [Nocardia goodfellowii]
MVSTPATWATSECRGIESTGGCGLDARGVAADQDRRAAAAAQFGQEVATGDAGRAVDGDGLGGVRVRHEKNTMTFW